MTSQVVISSCIVALEIGKPWSDAPGFLCYFGNIYREHGLYRGKIYLPTILK